MTRAEEDENIQFAWGKKRGLGGKKKDVQFYESFTYDGVEYALYDSVYLYTDSDSEPHVGKIIKIWENSDKTKKVKILWFFRPCEILNYLNGNKVCQNELFLASGDGTGLTNINPLEAIAGKCNVICVSKDNRNLQPSQEELQKADFIFYRAFDVGRKMILDKIDDKIALVDGKFLLNKLHSQKSSAVTERDPVKKEDLGNATVAGGTTLSFEMTASGEQKTLKADNCLIDILAKENGDSNVLITQRSLSNDTITLKSKDDPVKGHSKAGLILATEVQVEEGVEATEDSVRFANRPLKDDKHDSSVKASDSNKEIIVQKLVRDSSCCDAKAVSQTVTAFEDKSKRKFVKDPQETEFISSKRPKLDEKLTKFANENLPRESPQDVSNDDAVRGNGKVGKVPAPAISQTVTAFEDKSKHKSVKDPQETEFISSKRPKLDEKLTKFDNENLPRESPQEVSNDDAVRGNGKVGKVPAPDAQIKKKLKAVEDCSRYLPSKNDALNYSIQPSDSNKEKSDGNKGKIVQKLVQDSQCYDAKPTGKTIAVVEKSRPQLIKESDEKKIISSNKPKVDGKPMQFSNGKLPGESSREACNDISKASSKILEVTRRPEVDKSKWFSGLPWEERIKAANESGRVVLLQNLDPSYTGAEVEDIVWHALKQHCTAKIIPRVEYSSPHSGQGFAIFKTKEAAETTITKLNEGCLMMSNGRPLVGSFAKLTFRGKPSTFFGHMSFDKTRQQQMQREMREAVSTSHCSQPNTIEYDMALEWCLKQEQTKLEWKKLYQRHGKELSKLKVAMKSR
ncbi:protein ANTI-SILENCING 1 [Mercurialis annua]|uniref:protein ANTI-SILENCING 1 n=1 Tax=Mercurialis annua TaxID=3986 RepID=UPI00215E553C|nr:protein ANTI-SILENCING 1 [Mercurialis annua]XP_050210248.1 protein ANTI-SILENCING 1 [Mercurialis annua]XP_050210249.1 protein ANTI-SILENCING 1 [Mercurialis annua]XP_050210250.1 protein ANTI-SILENCING 1 [Mercurialis annua]